jgi:hypothetical protein
MVLVLKKSFYILLFAGIVYATYLVLLLSVPYLSMKPHVDFLKTKQLIYHVKVWRFSFYVHVFTSIFCIAAGLFQFLPFVLKNYKKVHRILGFIYISVVLLLAGPSSLVMSFYANGGLVAKISFVLLSMLWLLSTSIAYYKIRTHTYLEHGNWMLRSYALTLSAVTLRFYAYLMDVFNWHLPPTEEYTLLAWLSWVPNLILAEILIKRKFYAHFL